MSESSQETRRRISSQSDTLRSCRSEHQSPRLIRPSQHSISAPPETPPLVRNTPQRHSVTAPVAPVATVISGTSSPTVTSSRDSLDQANICKMPILNSTLLVREVDCTRTFLRQLFLHAKCKIGDWWSPYSLPFKDYLIIRL